MIIDTHTHYDDDAFNEDRDHVLASLAAAGISHIVSVGADMASSRNAAALAGRLPFAWAAVGVHPDSTGELDDNAMAELLKLTMDANVRAIGEIGLDYHWNVETPETQEYWFRRQIDLARRSGLPILIHSREAAADTMRIIKDEKAGELGGIMHCYSYSLEQAREYVKMGFYLGIGGVVTYKNGRKLQEVVREIPLEHLVLETDCPYMAPHPHRGERNSSLLLPYVVEKIAELKGISVDEVISTTAENANHIFSKTP